MNLRSFNNRGIEEFRRFLASCRENPKTPIPNSLLEDDQFSELITPNIGVAQTNFTTKLEAATELDGMLSRLPEGEVLKNAGLWTWLTLFHFDSVCPSQTGTRNVKNDYYYVFEPLNARHYYRHLLFISWQVKRIAPQNNRLMLSSQVSILDHVTDRVMQKLYLTRIPCIFEVLDRLYWDADAQRPKRGITGNKPKRGDLRHRFPIRIRQLEKTYDLYSLEAEQLIELLGDEFA